MMVSRFDNDMSLSFSCRLITAGFPGRSRSCLGNDNQGFDRLKSKRKVGVQVAQLEPLLNVKLQMDKPELGVFAYKLPALSKVSGRTFETVT